MVFSIALIFVMSSSTLILICSAKTNCYRKCLRKCFYAMRVRCVCVCGWEWELFIEKNKIPNNSNIETPFKNLTTSKTHFFSHNRNNNSCYYELQKCRPFQTLDSSHFWGRHFCNSLYQNLSKMNVHNEKYCLRLFLYQPNVALLFVYNTHSWRKVGSSISNYLALQTKSETKQYFFRLLLALCLEYCFLRKLK